MADESPLTRVHRLPQSPVQQSDESFLCLELTASGAKLVSDENSILLYLQDLDCKRKNVVYAMSIPAAKQLADELGNLVEEYLNVSPDSSLEMG